MKFRPCIDIHNGKVKQLVGGSLKDEGDIAKENFVSNKDSSDYAKMYKEDGLTGGHIIILNAANSDYYEATKEQAVKALKSYPGGMQIGGGINDQNASYFIEQGASHVIVTSFVFKDGKVDYDRLNSLVDAVSKEHIVLDLSCRKKNDKYYIVTDRWQTYTDEEINLETLENLSNYCDEFLVHGVDSEGKSSGMEEGLVRIISQFDKIPVTYAGGIASVEQLEVFREYSRGKIDYTIGSALDIFGGNLSYDLIKNYK